MHVKKSKDRNLSESSVDGPDSVTNYNNSRRTAYSSQYSSDENKFSRKSSNVFRDRKLNNFSNQSTRAENSRTEKTTPVKCMNRGREAERSPRVSPKVYDSRRLYSPPPRFLKRGNSESVKDSGVQQNLSSEREDFKKEEDHTKHQEGRVQSQKGIIKIEEGCVQNQKGSMQRQEGNVQKPEGNMQKILCTHEDWSDELMDVNLNIQKSVAKVIEDGVLDEKTDTVQNLTSKKLTEKGERHGFGRPNDKHAEIMCSEESDHHKPELSQEQPSYGKVATEVNNDASRSIVSQAEDWTSEVDEIQIHKQDGPYETGSTGNNTEFKLKSKKNENVERNSDIFSQMQEQVKETMIKEDNVSGIGKANVNVTFLQAQKESEKSLLQADDWIENKGSDGKPEINHNDRKVSGQDHNVKDPDKYLWQKRLVILNSVADSNLCFKNDQLMTEIVDATDTVQNEEIIDVQDTLETVSKLENMPTADNLRSQSEKKSDSSKEVSLIENKFSVSGWNELDNDTSRSESEELLLVRDNTDEEQSVDVARDHMSKSTYDHITEERMKVLDQDLGTKNTTSEDEYEVPRKSPYKKYLRHVRRCRIRGGTGSHTRLLTKYGHEGEEGSDSKSEEIKRATNYRQKRGNLDRAGLSREIMIQNEESVKRAVIVNKTSFGCQKEQKDVADGPCVLKTAVSKKSLKATSISGHNSSDGINQHVHVAHNESIEEEKERQIRERSSDATGDCGINSATYTLDSVKSHVTKKLRSSVRNIDRDSLESDHNSVNEKASHSQSLCNSPNTLSGVTTMSEDDHDDGTNSNASDCGHMNRIKINSISSWKTSAVNNSGELSSGNENVEEHAIERKLFEKPYNYAPKVKDVSENLHTNTSVPKVSGKEGEECLTADDILSEDFESKKSSLNCKCSAKDVTFWLWKSCRCQPQPYLCEVQPATEVQYATTNTGPINAESSNSGSRAAGPSEKEKFVWQYGSPPVLGWGPKGPTRRLPVHRTINPEHGTYSLIII